LLNTKRLGRYHNYNRSTNNNNDHPVSDIAQLYKEINRNPHPDWNKPLFGNKHTSFQKILADANKTIERSTKFLNKIKSRQLACANRAKSIPQNATIRKEYIKCGKEMCELKHGPYYYAYWKDPESKKLKKKYIGNHMPKDKELKNYSNNDDQTYEQML
jgi:hypothetical protein